MSDNPLSDSECGCCGCYCFSSPTPWRWNKKKTSKGIIQMCDGCFEDYGDSDDPRTDYRRDRLEEELAYAESRVSELEEELSELDA